VGVIVDAVVAGLWSKIARERGVRWEPKAAAAVHKPVAAGVTPMWKSILNEAREVVWLATLVGGLSAIGVGIAVALVAV
jgi:hypothetical protein